MSTASMAMATTTTYPQIPVAAQEEHHLRGNKEQDFYRFNGNGNDKDDDIAVGSCRSPTRTSFKRTTTTTYPRFLVATLQEYHLKGNKEQDVVNSHQLLEQSYKDE